jgi:diacylglycerol O-acyltransferase
MKALSPTDSAFLWMETRNQPMHVAGLNIYTPPKGAGPEFVGEMMAEWRKHLSAQAPFNLKPKLRFGMWYWEEDKDFEMDYHVRHLALPQPGRIRELLALVSRVHGNLMDRNRPLWEAYVIEGLPDGRFATYIKMHHALIDGVSGAKMTAQAMSTTAKEHKPPLWAQTLGKAPKPRPAASSKGLLDQLNELAHAGREILPGIGAGLVDLARSAAGEETPIAALKAPPTAFNVEISGSRRFAAQSFALSRFKRIGQAANATVNDVTLAICAGALRQYLQTHAKLPAKPLVAMVPVSLHGETDLGGNQVTLLLAELGTHIKDPLKRLEKIKASTTQAKDKLRSMSRLQKMAYGMTSIATFGPALVTKLAGKYPPFNLVISNVPGSREALYMDGASLDEIYPVSIPTHYLALNITISGYRDNLGFGFIACRRSVPALQRMLDYTAQSIEELEQALGIEAPVEKPRAAKVAAKKTVKKKPKV